VLTEHWHAMWHALLAKGLPLGLPPTSKGRKALGNTGPQYHSFTKQSNVTGTGQWAAGLAAATS